MGASNMKNILKISLSFTLCALSFNAIAGPECTTEPRDKWKQPAEVLAEASKEVTKMKLFKVTKGNCYELYGWNEKEEKLEIYYHPVTGKEVKRGSW